MRVKKGKEEDSKQSRIILSYIQTIFKIKYPKIKYITFNNQLSGWDSLVPQLTPISLREHTEGMRVFLCLRKLRAGDLWVGVISL